MKYLVASYHGDATGRFPEIDAYTNGGQKGVYPRLETGRQQGNTS